MRISRRYGVVLAIAAAGALAVAGVAVAGTASNGNVADFGASISPNKVPKKKFKAATLKFNSSTVFADPGVQPNGGATHRLQVWLDKNVKINPKATKTCNSDKIEGNITMAQAMAACGKSKVGTGKLEAYNFANPAHPVPGCGLSFNSKKGGKPALLVFVRTQVGGPTPQMSCKDPRNNNQGNVTVLLAGKIKNASGKYGYQIDINDIEQNAALPLQADAFKFKKGNYISARCKSKKKTWHFKAKHTYTDNVTVTDKKKQKCKRK
jgi:hypothetical protein